MTVTERLRDWIRGQTNIAASTPPPHTTARPLPAVLQPWRPQPVATLPRPTAANLRRLSEQPIVRRAINLVKDRVANMPWQVRLKQGVVPTDAHSGQLRTLRRLMEAPNPRDSYRTLLEQVLEDTVVGGFGAVEIEHTGDAATPLRLWPVDGALIQVDSDWAGNADAPRYALSGSPYGGTAQPLLDRELMYVRLNPRTHTPLGLGRVEVAFDTVHQFLSAHRHAGRLAGNSVAQFALWIDDATPAQHERLVRWWQDEVEGSGEVPILSTGRKPEVLRFGAGTDEDLRLQWQEFLLRVIANAFDLSPMFLGLHEDVNRSTAEELSSQSFETAVLPVASLLAEHITRDVFDKALGWADCEFVFATEARDETTELSMQLQLLKAGVLSVDEVRAARGMSSRLVTQQQQQTEEEDASASHGSPLS